MGWQGRCRVLEEARDVEGLRTVAVKLAQALDSGVGDSKSYSPYLTFWPSEFQRLRLQYTYLSQPGIPQVPAYANQVFLQWTAILGSHAHGFRDR